MPCARRGRFERVDDWGAWCENFSQKCAKKVEQTFLSARIMGAFWHAQTGMPAPPSCAPRGRGATVARRHESQLQNSVFKFVVPALCRRKRVNSGAGGRRFRRHSAGTTGALRFLLILQLAQKYLRRFLDAECLLRKLLFIYRAPARRAGGGAGGVIPTRKRC
jgi:hypothetical protein